MVSHLSSEAEDGSEHQSPRNVRANFALLHEELLCVDHQMLCTAHAPNLHFAVWLFKIPSVPLVYIAVIKCRNQSKTQNNPEVGVLLNL